MAKGIALTIGLNSVDPDHYAGWSGELNACESDANDMTRIVKSQKFEVKTLLTKDAARKNVTDGIESAASNLKAGDIFMMSYSGHGGQLPDLNSDETDGQDETWCLYDGEIVDDELYSLYSKFAQNVRILIFSDSCHSGTVTKEAYLKNKMDIRNTNVDLNGTKYRLMPTNVALQTYRKNQEFYDKILQNPAIKDSQKEIKASSILISGCKDNQTSADGAFNGLFTSQLLQVWKNGAFKGNYPDFFKTILRRMPPEQSPNYYITGQKDAKFESQKPFTV
jgi:metacaspase-1